MSDNRGSQALRVIFRGMKQVELAEKTGLSQSFLSRLAGGAKPKLLEDALALAAEGIEIEWWDEPPLHTKKLANRRNSSAAE